MHRTVPVALFSALAALPNVLDAQRHVVLSEIRADGGDRWVELLNRSAASVDLSDWTLYYATATPNLPQTYFYGFFPGTQLPAGERLLVHWYQPRPASMPANEQWTGDTIYHFLFGLGAEPLLGNGGALALLRSQSNQQMGNASLLEDWVGWGRSGLAREALAVQAGVWLPNAAAPAIPAGGSLARNEVAIGTVANPAEEWFVDTTPTPLQANVPGLQLDSLGAPCSTTGSRLFGLPTLTAESTPVIGNRDFGLRIDNTSGVLFETVLLAFASAPAPANMPQLLPSAPGSSACALLLDYQSVFALRAVVSQPLQTRVPLSLQNLSPALAGLQFYVQAIVLDRYAGYLPFQGVSNALRVRLGG